MLHCRHFPVCGPMHNEMIHTYFTMKKRNLTSFFCAETGQHL